MTAYDVAVVGGGPAGLAAAMNARMRGLSTVLFEAESFGGQLVNLYPTKPVDNFPTYGEIISGELARRLSRQVGGYGVELSEWEPVESVGPADGHFVLRTDRRQVEASSLILALGLGRFVPRRLGHAGEEQYLGRGVAYRVPPVDQIGGHVVVVGGGDTAVDTALSLEKRADITLVHRGAELRAYGHSLERLERSSVRVLRNTEVVGLAGEGKLERVLLSRKEDGSMEVPADLLLVTIGQVPDLSGVNSAMETDRPGLFAVGDFAGYPGKVKMIATAWAEGSTAAASAQRYLAHKA